MTRLVLVTVCAPLLLALVLASCSSDTSSKPTIASTDGEELFSMRALGREPGCVTCHSLVPERTLVGPSLAGLSNRASTAVPGLDAETYIKTSIINPDQHVVDGFDAGKMPQSFGEILSENQVLALIDYLLEVEE